MSFAVKGFDVAVVNRGRDGRRIDWPAVADSKEADFCMIRILDGTLDDADGEYNCAGAASSGLPFLVYQPFYPRVDGKRQAQLLAERVRDLGVRAAGDFEVNSGISPADYLSLANTYVEEFEQRAGREMVIYTSPWFGSTYLQGKFSSRPLWIANPYNKKPSLPKGWRTWLFWQYSWVKSFNGIADPTVDGDYFNGTLEQMREFFGFARPPEPLSLEQKVERLWEAHPELQERV